MTLSKALLATGLVTVLVGVAPSAFAQHRGGGGERSRGASVSRGAASRGGASRGGGFSRGESRSVSPRSYSGSQGIYSGRASIAPRGFSGGRGRDFVRGGGRYSSFAPVRFYRPYYTFRPRVSLGFGLWAGYPLAYSSAYYDPFYEPPGYSSYGYPAYDYPPPSTYPPSTYPPSNYPPSNYPRSNYPPSNYPPSNYPPSNYPSSAYPADRQHSQGSVAVQPRQSNETGGLSFEITPSTAELFVDGAPVGTVGEFTPTTQPLGLPAGRHEIEVRARGYRTMTLDVNIIAGQVIPYQGTLER
jgi:hypothetical protein